jgi:hypothetical protein
MPYIIATVHLSVNSLKYNVNEEKKKKYDSRVPIIRNSTATTTILTKTYVTGRKHNDKVNSYIRG